MHYLDLLSYLAVRTFFMSLRSSSVEVPGFTQQLWRQPAPEPSSQYTVNSYAQQKIHTDFISIISTSTLESSS